MVALHGDSSHSCARLNRIAIRLHRHINCDSNNVNDIVTRMRPTIKYVQQANNWRSGPWNVLRGTKSAKPIVDMVTKQKYAPSTKLQFSHTEKMAVPIEMYTIKIDTITNTGTCVSFGRSSTAFGNPAIADAWYSLTLPARPSYGSMVSRDAFPSNSLHFVRWFKAINGIRDGVPCAQLQKKRRKQRKKTHMM